MTVSREYQGTNRGPDARWHWDQMMAAINANAWPPDYKTFVASIDTLWGQGYRAGLAEGEERAYATHWEWIAEAICGLCSHEPDENPHDDDCGVCAAYVAARLADRDRGAPREREEGVDRG